MITGELKHRVDRVWKAFWEGGIANPLQVIEQITYLIFIKRLDDLQIAKENKATRTGRLVENPIYPDDPDVQKLRWSHFKNEHPDNMLVIVRDGVFPWLRGLRGEGTTYATHMKDAQFVIPTSNLLTKAVDLIDDIPLGERDTKGDIYEYMLGKIATAGQNGQFRTPRHIIRLMVEMMAPGPNDEICDPACGTAGFLMEAARFVSLMHEEALLDLAQRKHFNHSMFHGFDFDSTMLRIASMNMLLHEVEQPDIRYRDSLAESAAGEADRYTMIFANPPFSGSLDSERVAKDLQQIVKTQKTELLFLALFLRLLKPGGRAAVVVPEGVLFDSSKPHGDIRKLLVDGHKLEAVIKLPGGVFRPYSGVSTAILVFTRTDSGGTDQVWFYEVEADGFSLDTERAPLLAEDELGPTPIIALDEADHAKNNLPDVLARWARRNGSERERARTEQSFCVPREEIEAAGYDLSIKKYKAIVHQKIEHRSPTDLVAELHRLEDKIGHDLSYISAILEEALAGLEHVPSGWVEVPFSEVLKESPRNGLSPSTAGSVTAKVLTLSAVTGFQFNPDAVKLGTFKTVPPVHLSVNRDDFLICRGNGNPDLVGRGYFPFSDMPDVTFPDTIIAARVDPSAVSRECLEFIWSAPGVRAQIKAAARTTNGTFKINQKAVEAIRIVIPSEDVQQVISRCVTTVAQLRGHYAAGLATLDRLVASLQHRTFHTQ